MPKPISSPQDPTQTTEVQNPFPSEFNNSWFAWLEFQAELVEFQVRLEKEQSNMVMHDPAILGRALMEQALMDQSPTDKGPITPVPFQVALEINPAIPVIH